MMTPNTTQTGQEGALKQLLDSQAGKRSRRRWFWLAGVLAVIAGAAALLLPRGEDTVGARYVTEPAGIGTLVVKVSATGNLQPTNQVDVGSELSGIVDQVFVDVNDTVTKGQELARLDLAKLRDSVAKSRANLAAAQAQVLQTQATLAEARATFARYKQVAELSGGKVPSKTEMDAAVADVKRAEANEASAMAGVVQAEANLQSDETDLAKASIRSPFDGVVLVRDVEPGQTVAASFQAPVLFTLAEDLSTMELQVDVDEADVAQVREGQNATFSVDAWPGRRFEAVITRVSYGSQEKDNVISYLTVLAVDNGDFSLRPGMTGTAEITTAIRENALLVPNAALRFNPETGAPPQKKSGGGILNSLMPRPPSQPPKAKAPRDGTPRVWVLRNEQPTAVEVRTGISNGRLTEILEGALEAGTQVITEAAGTGS